VVGAVAAAIYGRPRVTKDIDLVAIADEQTWPDLLRKGTKFGIEPRQPDALDFARVTRVLLLRHSPSTVDVDLSFAGLEFENEMIAAARLARVAEISIPLARPEDVLVMKCLALRPRDIADIEGILQAQRGLDLDRVRAIIVQFSEALEQADLVSEWDRLVKRVLR
jgi:hypothetical protein